MDNAHLNQKAVEMWMNLYILKETKYTINNKKQLNKYMNEIISIQNSGELK